MQTLQEKFSKADTIVRETKIMLKMQKDYFEDRSPVFLNTLKIQTTKVGELIDEYYPKPKSLRKEE